MTPAFAARRRAEEFDELVEHASTAELENTRYGDLVSVLTMLREPAPVAPRAEFARDLRSRLMVAASAATAAMAVDTPTQAAARRAPARRTGRDRKIAAALAGFAIVSASTSMAVAAQTALPGDSLYPLKRAIENAHAGVQSGDDKGSTLLANASGRLQEVQEMSGASGADDATSISQTLQDFTDEASEASGLLLSDYQQNGHMSSLEQLREFTSDSMLTLTQLENIVPSAARGSLFTARQLLAQIDQQARESCPGCTAAALPELASHAVPKLLESLIGHALSAKDTPEPADHSTDAPQTSAGQQITDHSHGPAATDHQSTSDASDQPSGAPGGVSAPHDPIRGLANALTGGGGSGASSHGIGGLLTGADDVVTSILNGLTGHGG